MKLYNPVISTTTLFLLLSLLAIGQENGQKSVVSTSSNDGAGAVVEKVRSELAAEKAGLQEGDLLLNWTRDDAKGSIDSPFDLSLVEVEQAPRGAIIVEGLRKNKKLTWKLEAGSWGIATRPNLPTDLLVLYQQGRTLAQSGKLKEAAESWRTVAAKTDPSAPPWLRLWLLFHVADSLAEERQWKETDAAYEEVIAQSKSVQPEIKVLLLRSWAMTFDQRADWVNAEKHYEQAVEASHTLNPESLLFADLLDGVGYGASERSDLAKAEKCYSQALAIQQKLAPGSMDVAKSLNGLGLIDRRHGNLTKAEDYFQQALAIREKLAPGSLDTAASLTSIGGVALARGDLNKAEDYFLQSLQIRQKLAPNSLDVARAFNNLGAVANNRGDLAKAEEYFRQSLAIRQALAPDSLEMAGALNNLGKVVWDRGDLIKAEEYYRQALAIQEKSAPDSLNLSAILVNLGLVEENRGDLVKAEEYERRALEIREKLAPDSIDVAQSLNDLGNVAWHSGDLTRAEEYYKKNLQILERLAPDGPAIADVISNLGVVARDRGDVAGAEQYQRRSLAIYEKLAPGSLAVANTLNELGNVAQLNGNFSQAEQYYRQALEIHEKLDPEKQNYAENLANLARVMVRKGDLDAAAQLWEKALTAVEGQASHLGGSEAVRSGFRVKFLGYYLEYIDLLVRLKRPDVAFHELERSRARSLLEMLAEAHIDIHKGTDGALLERERSLQSDISAKYNRRIRLLSGKHTDEQTAAINQEIEKLLAQQKDNEEAIRANSPSYAALVLPRPLDANQIQRLLDDETLLLAYSLGEDRSYLFAVTRDSLHIYTLPAGIDIEALALRAYKELSVNDPAASYDSTTALSETLLGPVAEQLGKKRLAIVSDGALQYLPFAALRTHQGTPLIDEHEIVNLPSASTLAILRQETSARKAAPKQVAVLADPVFDVNDERLKSPAAGDLPKKATAENESNTGSAEASSATGDLLTRSATDMGLTAKGSLYLPRLISTRQEAQSILAMVKPSQALEALDFDASRATATSTSLAQYRIVHLATHGLLNSSHPELSGLVLSLVDRQAKPQNGFLSLQDIYNLNLPADLVVLSACETALGQRVEGEGLIGLTRAFMYAGAPRVVASLWRVPDRATAELMKQFYTAMLSEGLSPAAALRKAQINLAKDKRWSAPYYWAAFTLQGEWK